MSDQPDPHQEPQQHPEPHSGLGEESQPDAEAALIAALVELERHVGGAGWDAPTRLFALVHTETLLAAEPGLADQVAPPGSTLLPGALTAIEQEGFGSDHRLADDLLGALAEIVWPDTVYGCALATERTFLPAGAEADIPADPAEAAAFVAGHPQRQDVRVVVGVDRAGNRHGVGRLASRPEDLLGAADLVPGLASALAHTLT